MRKLKSNLHRIGFQQPINPSEIVMSCSKYLTNRLGENNYLTCVIKFLFLLIIVGINQFKSNNLEIIRICFCFCIWTN